MKKKHVLLAAVMLLTMAGLVKAQEGELHGVIDLTFQSKYIWRGFDIYGDKSAIQPSIGLDLYGTGFGVNIMGHRANSSEFEDGERWDYTLYYGNKFFEDETYATNYGLSWVYYNFPDSSSHTSGSTDLQEMNAIFSWPKILPVEGLVPSYVIIRLWPYNSNSPVSQAAGWAHVFMLDYGLPIPGMLPETPEQILHLHTELVYNDGVDPRPGSTGVDHDWSNAVFGVSTDFDLGNNLSFTPGIYHQVTMDKSVNPDKDETWVALSMKYKF